MEFVLLLDRGLRVLWSSQACASYIGTLALELIPDKSHAQIKEAFADLLCHGHDATFDIEFLSAPIRCTMLAIGDLPSIVAAIIAQPLAPGRRAITAADREILRLLANDLTIREVATEMSRSESAIHSRVKIVKSQLDRRGLTGLVAEAVRLGIV